MCKDCIKLIVFFNNFSRDNIFLPLLDALSDLIFFKSVYWLEFKREPISNKVFRCIYTWVSLNYGRHCIIHIFKFLKVPLKLLLTMYLKIGNDLPRMYVLRVLRWVLRCTY